MYGKNEQEAGTYNADGNSRNRVAVMGDTNIGGSSVGGNASAGGDYAGRDKYSSNEGRNQNHVDVHTAPYQKADDSSDTEILRNLHRAILGNPYNIRNEPGLLKSVNDLADALTETQRWRETMEREWRGSMTRQETTDSRLTAFTVIVWATISVVGIETVALIWLVIQMSLR